ncbi:MAG: hypothetical protein ACYTER_03615 [Planctomycetota bacterium]|jgi:hypothetical protein
MTTITVTNTTPQRHVAGQIRRNVAVLLRLKPPVAAEPIHQSVAVLRRQKRLPVAVAMILPSAVVQKPQKRAPKPVPQAARRPVVLQKKAQKPVLQAAPKPAVQKHKRNLPHFSIVKPCFVSSDEHGFFCFFGQFGTEWPASGAIL